TPSTTGSRPLIGPRLQFAELASIGSATQILSVDRSRVFCLTGSKPPRGRAIVEGAVNRPVGRRRPRGERQKSAASLRTMPCYLTQEAHGADAEVADVVDVNGRPLGKIDKVFLLALSIIAVLAVTGWWQVEQPEPTLDRCLAFSAGTLTTVLCR